MGDDKAINAMRAHELAQSRKAFAIRVFHAVFPFPFLCLLSVGHQPFARISFLT